MSRKNNEIFVKKSKKLSEMQSKYWTFVKSNDLLCKFSEILLNQC